MFILERDFRDFFGNIFTATVQKSMVMHCIGYTIIMA